MLTPHELAQLFVIVHASEGADPDNPELDALVELDLVQRVVLHGGRMEVRVTSHGTEVLARLARGYVSSQSSCKRLYRAS